MILFPHTRWQKFKTAWVWYHYDEHLVSVRLPPFFRKCRRFKGAGKELCRLRWEGDKPFVVWKAAPKDTHQDKEDKKGKRYLCPEGKVLDRSAARWSCAYPERALWYPRVDPFKDDYVTTRVGYQMFQVPANPPGIVGMNYQNQYVMIGGVMAGAVEAALQNIAHPVADHAEDALGGYDLHDHDEDDFEDDLNLDDLLVDPDE